MKGGDREVDQRPGEPLHIAWLHPTSHEQYAANGGLEDTVTMAMLSRVSSKGLWNAMAIDPCPV